METVFVLKCKKCSTSAAIVSKEGCSICGGKKFWLLEKIPYEGTVVSKKSIKL